MILPFPVVHCSSSTRIQAALLSAGPGNTSSLKREQIIGDSSGIQPLSSHCC